MQIRRTTHGRIPAATPGGKKREERGLQTAEMSKGEATNEKPTPVPEDARFGSLKAAFHCAGVCLQPSRQGGCAPQSQV